MSNANLRLSTLSVEPLYVSFRAENPVTGPFDFSTATADIAVVRQNPTSSDWLSATVEADTYRAPDGERYYVAAATVDGSTLSPGEYQIYLRVSEGPHTFVQRAGSVQVY